MPGRKKLTAAQRAKIYKTRRPKTKAFRPTPDYDWFTGRIAALWGENQEMTIPALSRRVFLGNRNALTNVISGNERARILRPEEVIQLARELRVPIQTVLFNLGYDLLVPQVPVVGTVDRFGHVAFKPEGPIDAPLEIANDLQAVRVDAPRSPWHDLYLFYAKPEGVSVNARGHLAVIEIEGEPAPVVGTLDANRRNVTLIGGTETLPARGLRSASRILWMRYT